MNFCHYTHSFSKFENLGFRSRNPLDPSFTNGSFLQRPATYIPQRVLKLGKPRIPRKYLGVKFNQKNHEVFGSFLVPPRTLSDFPGFHDDPWHTWRRPTFCRIGTWPCRRVGMVGTWAAWPWGETMTVLMRDVLRKRFQNCQWFK